MIKRMQQQQQLKERINIMRKKKSIMGEKYKKKR